MDTSYIKEIKEALLKPRFKLKEVFIGVLAGYMILIFFLYISFYYSPAEKITNSTSWAGSVFSAKAIVNHISWFIFILVLYYVLLNLFYVSFKQKARPLFYCIIFLLIIFFHEFTRLLLDLALGKTTVKDHYSGDAGAFSGDLLISTILFSIPAVIFVYRALQKDEVIKNKGLMEKNKLLELQKLTAENNLLKARINPHFLQNTLSFLYSKTRQYDKDLSEAVLLLGEIMRYSLMATEHPDDLICLRDETVHLKNLVQLQQLRFNNQLNIWFVVNGDTSALQVPPLTLITIAENAFKYGDLYDSLHPVQIHLTVCNEKRKMEYRVSNKKKNGPVEISHGIGQDNIRQRLAHAFPEKYSLVIKNEEDFYTVFLTVNF